MADDNLFGGLPPPSLRQNLEEAPKVAFQAPATVPVVNLAPAPALKSAMKRPKPAEPVEAPKSEADAPSEKRLRFKTTTDASELQVIEAMQKIASHIKNPGKFGKASKLAIQLIQAGSVKPGTSDYFFAILEAAMSSSTSCTDPSVKSGYHALFTAAQDAIECLNKKQKNLLTSWTLRAVVANDLLTDDSFLFSKTAAQLKEVISNLPVATEDDDAEEAESLKDATDVTDEDRQKRNGEEQKQDVSDPFGLDALIPSSVKRDDKTKGRKDGSSSKLRKEEEEETKRFLKSQREALIICLEIAARRYKLPWCQTVIDILVKHASDNVSRFTSQQRDAIGKLWTSIREQQTRRKQGKSVTGKLDMNAFEFLQQKYSTEKISIRRAVGGSGDRRAQQWLG